MTCRDAANPSLPCRFTRYCSESRRELHSSLGLNGTKCWAYGKWLIRYPLTGLVKTPETLDRESVDGV